jgi:DNA polymerase elongation subunit (family B)
MSSRAIDTQWWTTTTTKNRMWKTTIVRIVFDVVVYQLIVVVSRVSSATDVLDKKLRVFWYVVSSCVVDSLFNSRRFRFVFVSSSINCRTFVSFYASIRGFIEKMLMRLIKKRYELMKKNCFLWKISRNRFAFLLSERL